jgi:hypothetical protein
MRRAIAIGACALAFGSCSKKEPAPAKPPRVTTVFIPEDASREKKRVFVTPVPDIIDKALLGDQLAPDGTVIKDAAVFRPGQPVSLTLWLKQSPPGLATSAKWLDGKDKEIAREQRPMNGAKVATFTLKQTLAPGKYHVTGYWGGNVVAEKDFEVVAEGKKK